MGVCILSTIATELSNELGIAVKTGFVISVFVLRYIHNLAANVQALALWRNSGIRQPGTVAD